MPSHERKSQPSTLIINLDRARHPVKEVVIVFEEPGRSRLGTRKSVDVRIKLDPRDQRAYQAFTDSVTDVAAAMLETNVLPKGDIYQSASEVDTAINYFRAFAYLTTHSQKVIWTRDDARNHLKNILDITLNMRNLEGWQGSIGRRFRKIMLENFDEAQYQFKDAKEARKVIERGGSFPGAFFERVTVATLPERKKK